LPRIEKRRREKRKLERRGWLSGKGRESASKFPMPPEKEKEREKRPETRPGGDLGIIKPFFFLLQFVKEKEKGEERKEGGREDREAQRRKKEREKSFSP